MREIKFRTWNVINKYFMANNTFAIGPDGDLLELSEVDSERDIWSYAYPLQNPNFNNGEKHHIIEQYTGLKDKNGKEIYEGDILKSEWYMNLQRLEKAQVVFSSGKFTCRGLKCDLYLMPDIEVIGNIHENPELLEDKS